MSENRPLKPQGSFQQQEVFVRRVGDILFRVLVFPLGLIVVLAYILSGGRIVLD